MKIDFQQLLGGDRRTLARAITLVESQATEDRAAAEQLINQVLPHSGRSSRIGISGAPGVGKSTFIDAFGTHLIELGHKVAVLAIDPSSPTSGGSILGDKLRMQSLSANPNAYVRPSPAGERLGGVASRTRDTIPCCEAAGFDIIIVETVGVGQSEVSVAAMVDLFVILLQPAAGDEVQGIKRGILDLVDMAIVNKSDGELVDAAESTAQQYRSAFSAAPRKRNSRYVATCSALEGTGVPEVWMELRSEIHSRKASGDFEAKRARQSLDALDEMFEIMLRSEIQNCDSFSQRKRSLQDRVATGDLSPSAAATELAARIRAGLAAIAHASCTD
ncbi:MAG: methylmalonyl Co-A mutase-associated GTPase MeaB [Aureliella sp.]